MRQRRLAVLCATVIVAKDTTRARAADAQHRRDGSSPEKGRAAEGSGRRTKHPEQAFTPRLKWRITTGRTAPPRSDVNPMEGGINHEQRNNH